MKQIMIKPFKGNYPITQPYGVRVDYMRCGYHTGIDYALPTGTPIYSASEGRVILSYSWKLTGYGREIRIQRDDGLITQYAHLSKIYVKTGQLVKQGDLIGKSGHSGHCISLHGGTGAHLHFGTMFNHKWFNPASILKNSSLNLQTKIDYTKRKKGMSRREWWSKITGLPKTEAPFSKKKKIEIKKEEKIEKYEVKRGDSLTLIAEKELGNIEKWKQIFKDNRDIIDDPNLIRPGQILKLKK